MSWQQYLRYHPVFQSKLKKRARKGSPTLQQLQDEEEEQRTHAGDRGESSSSSFLDTPSSFYDPLLDLPSNMDSVTLLKRTKKGVGAALSAKGTRTSELRSALESVPRPRNTLAMHEQTLALIMEGELRLLDLRKFKKAMDRVQNQLDPNQLKAYFCQNCPYRVVVAHEMDLDFDVIQLEFDPYGRFLAILGLRRLVVVDLDSKVMLPGGPSHTLKQFFKHTRKARTKQHAVHAQQHSKAASSAHALYRVCLGYDLGSTDLAFGKAQLLQCAWSQHCYEAGTVYVLSEDGLLRVYDLAVSTELPYASHPMLNAHMLAEHTNPLSPNTDAAHPVSMALGTAESPATHVWHAFTVFGAMRNGDVYALCPVMPSSCLVLRSQWEAMHRSVESAPDDATQSTLAQFLRGVHVQNVDAEWVQLQPPVLDAYTLAPQPVVVEGATSEAMKSSETDATDLLALSHAPLLLTAYRNGHIDVTLLDQVFPEWGPLLHTRHGPCASLALQTVPCLLLQTLDLETHGDLRFLPGTALLPSPPPAETVTPTPSTASDAPMPASGEDPRAPSADALPTLPAHTLHVYHARGVHQLHFPGDGPGAAQDLQSTLYAVLETVPRGTDVAYNPVVGAQCLLDPLLDPTLLARTLDDVLAVPLYPFDLDTAVLAAFDAPARAPVLPPMLPALALEDLVLPSFIALRCTDATWSPDLLTYLQGVYQRVAKTLHQLNQFSLDLRAHLHAQRHWAQAAEDVLLTLPTPALALPPLELTATQLRTLRRHADALLQTVYDHVHTGTVAPLEAQYGALVRECRLEVKSFQQRCQKLLRHKLDRGPRAVPEGGEWSDAQIMRLQRVLCKQYDELDQLQSALSTIHLSE